MNFVYCLIVFNYKIKNSNYIFYLEDFDNLKQ